MKTVIYCDICGAKINPGEPVTIKNGITAYHSYCYTKDLNKELSPKRVKKINKQALRA